MGGSWFFLSFVGITILVVVVGFIRNRRFRQQEKWHHGLADHLNLEIAYMNARHFTIYGSMRTYPLRIEPHDLKNNGKKTKRRGIRMTIPMVNPNRKGLVIIKAHPSWPEITELSQLDDPIIVKHEIAEWLTIHTNDLFFSSLILSEDLKISLYDVFNRLEAGALYILDEDLSMVIPGLPMSLLSEDTYARIAELLCDVKDELR